MITYGYFMTPMGTMTVGTTEKGVCLLRFGGSLGSLNELARRMKRTLSPEGDPLITSLQEQLHAYFSGQRREFDLPLHLEGTDFQRRVWTSLSQIPYGQTWSYKEQAVTLGNVKAIRAVAQANSKNPVALLLPCHRVIGSDGRLTGYAGGMERKRQLLTLEGALPLKST